MLNTDYPTDVRATAITGRSAIFFVFELVAVFAVLSLGAIALPHDKYLRYQAPNDAQAPVLYWIYERIHFDPTPIDVAFIGSSRTGNSVHSRRLEEDLASRGVSAHAVNFYCARAGVNLQYVIAKELLANRKVKLLVLEITEREERKGHDFFSLYADPSDVFAAPLFPNFNYLTDLARLPGRQFGLALDTALQSWGLRNPDFVPPLYEGPNLDHAEFIQTLDGVKHFRVAAHSEAEMQAIRAGWLRGVTRSILPQSLSDLEYHMPRYYTDQILDLARARGTDVVFLYSPQFAGPRSPPPYEIYASRASLVNPWTAVQDYRLWLDENHVNWSGAKRLTDYVADALASRSDLK